MTETSSEPWKWLVAPFYPCLITPHFAAVLDFMITWHMENSIGVLKKETDFDNLYPKELILANLLHSLGVLEHCTTPGSHQYTLFP